MHLILCGPSMSGKTTLGKKLADHLMCPYLDVDALIEAHYALQFKETLSCRFIYHKHGSLFFRSLEKEIICSLEPKSFSIIALGGGSLLENANVSHLKTLGSFIYLKTCPETLWKRMSLKGIPAYLDEKDPQGSFYESLQKRIPLYEQVANVSIDTDFQNEEETLLDLLAIVSTLRSSYGI